MTDITPFDDIQVSTQTIIALTNLRIDIQRMFDTLPVLSIPYPPTLKTKHDIENYLLRERVPFGSIVSIEFENNLRGFKILKSKKSTRKFFRNAICIVMLIPGKLINFKIPFRGKIQITGCKSYTHAFDCIQYLWTYLNRDPSLFILDGDVFQVFFNTVMTNINFDLGFRIVRERLDQYINTRTDFKSMLETSVGYAGVNIKIPFQHTKTQIHRLCFRDQTWVHDIISYDDYLAHLNEKDARKERQKRKNNTFLVFHKGTAIMSGMCPEHMRDAYYKFIDIIQNDAREFIEEII